jgi:hypothetical protein
MSNGIPDTMICNCGHVGDEHERTVAAPCEIEGCDCIAFDEAEDQDAER